MDEFQKRVFEVALRWIEWLRTASPHDRKVFDLAMQYLKHGWEVKAAVKDWPNGQPDLLFNCRPDVYVKQGKAEGVFEVETTESVGDKHTAEQRSAFTRWVKEDPAHRFFKEEVVKVP